MSKTVMIVEDNELNMKLFHTVGGARLPTVGTRNGIEALDLARKHHPDLILMDIQLPEVSGLEVTKWLKEDPELKAIPVVAVTAFAMKWRRGAHPRRWLRGLLVEPIFGRQVHRDHPPLSWHSLRNRSMTARVLVVDDVPAKRQLLEASLRRILRRAHGHERRGGARDLRARRVRHRALDVMMPDMDGLEVCRRLKAGLNHASYSGVMVTALDQPSDRVRGLRPVPTIFSPSRCRTWR